MVANIIIDGSGGEVLNGGRCNYHSTGYARGSGLRVGWVVVDVGVVGEDWREEGDVMLICFPGTRKRVLGGSEAIAGSSFGYLARPPRLSLVQRKRRCRCPMRQLVGLFVEVGEVVGPSVGPEEDVVDELRRPQKKVGGCC